MCMQQVLQHAGNKKFKKNAFLSITADTELYE